MANLREKGEWGRERQRDRGGERRLETDSVSPSAREVDSVII